MLKFVLIASLLVSAALAAPANGPTEEELEEAERQRLEAKYDFGAKVDDQINDGQLERSEKRENGKTVGFYRYSDGYVRRTVHYEADENGYRVTKEESEEIGDGPKFDVNGVADVDSSVAGSYQVKVEQKDDKLHYIGVGQ